jgi:hypothetical protein
MKTFSPEELLDRLEWRREIRNVMGRISHDYAVKQEAEVFGRYWSGREDVSLLLNAGGYSGKAAVEGYYAALGQEVALSSKLIQAKFPDVLGNKTPEEVSGVGMITYLPFESQVIEIADDGQTAKGIWNIRGSYCKLTAGGPVANWIFGWAAVDFVLEDGQWKVWHMQILFNVDHQCGVGFCEEEKVFEPVPGFEDIDTFQLPEPNVKDKGFEVFRPDRPRTVSPKCPEPYGTFDETFSYAV